MKIVSSQVYRLNPSIAIEDFDDRSLALHCTELRLVELNATARDLVHRLDGQATLHQVVQSIAEDYRQSPETILEDMQAIMSQMTELGIVEHVALKPERDPNTGCKATIDRS
jgi:hypothetical protein